MKKLIIIIFLFSLVLPLAWAGTLSIKSNPLEAEIMVANPQSQDFVFVGKTPFQIDMESLVSRYTKSNNFIIKLKKDGYEEYRLLTTKLGSSDLELNVGLEIAKNTRMTKHVDDYVTGLFEAQRLIRAKSYDEALKKLDKLESEYSQFSSVFEIKAGLFYIQRDFTKALSYYRKAFGINPDNLEAYRMMNYLEKHLAEKGKTK